MSPYARHKARSFLLLAMASTLLGAMSANATPPRDLDRYAQHVLETFGTPGMSVAIVERGRPAIVRTYGVRRIGESARVDEQTMFSMGSTTKAFTSALLAMLVDEGKLTWDTKVSDVLPGFKMYDAYVSSEMTVRDLLVHRSGLGLGAGDLMFYPTTTFSRAEIVHKLRYIKPATSFRSGFAYDNLLYVVAGQVVEAVCNASWEDVVRQRILAPLQMEHTSTSSVLPANANRAWPHARTSSNVRGAGAISPMESATNLDNAAPAGALNSSITDVARWLELQLGRGLDPRTKVQLYSEGQSREMWSPQTIIPVAPNPKPLQLAQSNFRAYALGWFVSDYRGQLVISHGGGVPGSVALVVLVPGRDVAFAFLTNSEETTALAAMQYRLLDHYIGAAGPDWVAALNETRQTRISQAQQSLSTSPAEGAAQGAGSPALSLEKYAARYRDDWYGFVSITHDANGLTLSFDHTPGMTSKLEYVRYNTFRTRWTDHAIEDAYVTFALQPDGSIDTVTMRAISPLADFSFDYQDLLFRPVH